MNSLRPSRLSNYALPLIGLALCLLVGWWQSTSASQAIVDYARVHTRPQVQGFLVWLYDNPFQTDAPLTLERPAPRLRQPRQEPPPRTYPFS